MSSTDGNPTPAEAAPGSLPPASGDASVAASDAAVGPQQGRTATRMARLSVALLLAINLLNYVDRYVLAAAVPRIEHDFFSPDDPNIDSWMGSLATAFLVSYMLTAPLFGWLADRFSRWKLMGIAVIAWSLASGASGLASTFAILFITRLAVGIGEAAYGPAAPTVIADLFPVSRRGSVLAWFYMAIPVGSALGYVLGGMVAEHWHWRWAFYLVVPPGVLLGLLCFLMPEPPRGASDALTQTGRRTRWADYLSLARTPSYVLNCAGMTAMTFALGGVSYWMPKYIHFYRGEPSLGQVNLIFGALTVVSGLSATLLGGLAGDRLSARWPGAYFLVSGAGMLLGFPCFLLVLVTPFPWAWIFIFLAEFCLFFNTGPTNTILANVTHPSVRSTAYALNILIIHLLGDAASPTLIGALSDRFQGNMNVGFLAVSGAILVGAVFWLCGARHLQRDTELATTRLGNS
ncbi:MAG TPA: MFS transporter [Pirellulales bacterium]|nr:MFS transporter [Pirellulales bacterium]